MQTRFLVFIVAFFFLTSCKQDPPQYNAYIDADLTYLSSNYAGRLLDLLVKRGESVKINQLLFKVEQVSESYDIKMSRLTTDNLMTQKQALVDQLHYNEANYHRTLQMQKQHAASQNDLDLAKEQLDVLKNQLAGIEFQIASSHIDTSNKNWQKMRKQNHALISGMIFDTYFNQGEYVQAGQPIVSLMTPENIKVIFFVPETDLSNLAIDQKVSISSDANPHLATGKISYISNQAEYTPPIIYSREERQKLVFRVEARLTTPNLKTIHLGQPVTLELIR